MGEQNALHSVKLDAIMFHMIIALDLDEKCEVLDAIYGYIFCGKDEIPPTESLKALAVWKMIKEQNGWDE